MPVVWHISHFFEKFPVVISSSLIIFLYFIYWIYFLLSYFFIDIGPVPLAITSTAPLKYYITY
nr:MAG TPA: hypothetical protein [Caudoviricetes sp.]